MKKTIILFVALYSIFLTGCYTINNNGQADNNNALENNNEIDPLTKVNEYLKNKEYVGKEAGTDYIMTLIFHDGDEPQLTIKFYKENNSKYYLTFNGSYHLYFDDDKLMLEVKYHAEGLPEIEMKKEIFIVEYLENYKVDYLKNIDESDNTSILNEIKG